MPAGKRNSLLIWKVALPAPKNMLSAKLLPTVVMPCGRLNPVGREVRLEQLENMEAEKLLPTEAMPCGRLNPAGSEVRSEQPANMPYTK